MTEIQVWAVIALSYAGLWHAINSWRHVRSAEAAEALLAKIGEVADQEE